MTPHEQNVAARAWADTDPAGALQAICSAGSLRALRRAYVALRREQPDAGRRGVREVIRVIRFAIRALARGSEFQPVGGELRIIELGWRGTSTLIVGGVAEHLAGVPVDAAGLSALAVVWRVWLAVARPIETRHVISVTAGDGRPLHRVPALVDLATLSPVEAVTVDGVPLVSAGPEPLSTWRRVRPGKQRAVAFAGPRSLGGQAVGDVVIRKLASLPRMDMRSPIVGDVARVAALAFGLTGYGPIPDTAGAVFVGGQNTPANRERWWKACEWLRHMTITINERTGEWVGLANVDPDGEGGVHLGPPAWWRGKGNKQRWRLSGALWRPVQIGGKKRRGAGGQEVFHSGLARTLAGLEARLCYAPTAGRGKAGRVPDTLRPERPGGAGLRVFVAWQDLLTLAGEAVPIDATARSARAEHARFLRRVDALIAAGYHVPERGGGAPIGDTVEIVRVVDGRGHGQVAGVWIRASARFCEAASGRREWERIPATRLLMAAGDD